MKEERTVLITGANRGLGLEFARSYHKLGYKVIGAVRDLNDAEELKTIAEEVHQVDLRDVAAIVKLKEDVGSQPIHLLINNAGVLYYEALGEVRKENMLEQFQVNTLAPLLVTKALIENLRSAQPVARIVNVGTRYGSISENTSGGDYGYRASKAALHSITKNMSVELKPLLVFSIHPGYCNTKLAKFQGPVPPADSVAKMVPIIEGLDESTNGTLWHGLENRLIAW
eukprot:CAMPEP_0196657484 /NCGR_PEP_ID=MMETSP1086-20130531/23677_1 /TAXON_ID=77921 /ORGANISM="Cyanoptyche  gloeocystis , Strain SAG4.97" /LENGTH=226 /DNA_ID=CAMNT_0041990629 /DNA_START=56 /DNA_END=736 /DNA_ORIENTATION=+